MAAVQNWLEDIRTAVLEVRRLEGAAGELEAKAGPHGAVTAGGHGTRDHMAPVERAAELRAEADLLSVRLAPMLHAATDALYGRSGRGGVARRRGILDADILCGYYLRGMDWPEVAGELVYGSDTKHPAKWCRTRAMGAIGYMERVGIRSLTDS